MTSSAKTLRALERAAMRMVDQNGWLITREDCKTYEKRRDEFEDAIAEHAQRKGAKRKGRR